METDGQAPGALVLPSSEMACLRQLTATRALHERLDLIGKPTPCTPSDAVRR
jgi:hypothetical protein